MTRDLLTKSSYQSRNLPEKERRNALDEVWERVCVRWSEKLRNKEACASVSCLLASESVRLSVRAGERAGAQWEKESQGEQALMCVYTHISTPLARRKSRDPWAKT